MTNKIVILDLDLTLTVDNFKLDLWRAQVVLLAQVRRRVRRVLDHLAQVAFWVKGANQSWIATLIAEHGDFKFKLIKLKTDLLIQIHRT